MSTSTEAVVARVAEIAERVGAPERIEIVDVELKGAGHRRLLRIYIDRPEGVSHADCEFISKNVGTILDVEEAVPGGGYTLEVSSPGVERRLSKPGDFSRFAGQPAVFRLKDPVAGRRHWEGILAGFEEGLVKLEPAAGEPLRFALDNVERANLKFQW